jgi:hypothetical protein
MSTVTIQKLNGRGDVVVAYQGDVVERVAGGVRLEARWVREPLDLGYTRFDTGDRFVEWFYTDRWYNIFEIHRADTDALKGWYCNVAAPATITAAVVSCRDLLLDLWVDLDGSMRILDEDEFAADTTMDAEMRVGAEMALAELIALVGARRPPFDRVAPSSSSDQRPVI